MSLPAARNHDQSVTAPTQPAHAIVWTDAPRAAAFGDWLASVQDRHALRASSLRPASADASFRRYFRVDAGHGSCIVMDAPPDKEDCRAFEHVARLMAEAGLNVPRVLEWDRANGFMLLSDLGTQTMMQSLVPERPQDNLARYLQAVDVLLAWQLASRPGLLPAYDDAMLREELELFAQWYVVAHRGFALDAEQRRTLSTTFETIVRENQGSPAVYVHRDFMPRNLMLPTVAMDEPGVQLTGGRLPSLGVLDFQDAVFGPITYDIASLMRDAFLSWEEDFVLDVTVRYWEKARAAGLAVGADFGAFYRAVEWMGLQRHLRIAGIFARLSLRDGKPQYLADAPRFIGYVRATAVRYRELRPLLRLLDKIEGIQDVSAYAFGRV